MICLKCGSQIPDDVFFCGVCGTEVTHASPQDVQSQMQAQFQMHKNAMRQSEMQIMGQAIEYFSQKKDTFNEYDVSTHNLINYATGTKNGLIIWGAILTVTFFSAMSVPGKGFRIFCTISLILSLIMLAGGILMKVNNRRKYRHYQSENFRLSKELYEYYSKYPNCPVGMEYVNPEILQKIMDIMVSGRADSIKEALDIFIKTNTQIIYSTYMKAIHALVGDIACFAPAFLFE